MEASQSALTCRSGRFDLVQNEAGIFEHGPAVQLQLGEQVRPQQLLRFVRTADEIGRCRRRSGGRLVRHLSAEFANFVHEVIGRGVEDGLEADKHMGKQLIRHCERVMLIQLFRRLRFCARERSRWFLLYFHISMHIAIPLTAFWPKFSLM